MPSALPCEDGSAANSEAASHASILSSAATTWHWQGSRLCSLHGSYANCRRCLFLPRVSVAVIGRRHLLEGAHIRFGFGSFGARHNFESQFDLHQRSLELLVDLAVAVELRLTGCYLLIECCRPIMTVSRSARSTVMVRSGSVACCPLILVRSSQTHQDHGLSAAITGVEPRFSEQKSPPKITAKTSVRPLLALLAVRRMSGSFLRVSSWRGEMTRCFAPRPTRGSLKKPLRSCYCGCRHTNVPDVASA